MLKVEQKYINGSMRWAATKNGEVVSHSSSYVLISNLARELDSNAIVTDILNSKESYEHQYWPPEGVRRMLAR